MLICTVRVLTYSRVRDFVSLNSRLENKKEEEELCVLHQKTTINTVQLELHRFLPFVPDDRLRVGWLDGSGRCAARAEDAQRTPSQSLPRVMFTLPQKFGADVPRSLLCHEVPHTSGTRCEY